MSLVTLTVHFVLIQVTLASCAVAGISQDHGQTALSRAPILFAFLINLGIPPLLSLQAIYGPLFYSGSILMAWQWIAVIPSLICVYGLIYFARYTKSLPCSRKAALLAAIGILGIAFIYSNMVSWMSHPGGWAESYQKAGTHLYPRRGETVLRWAWILGPALCWMGWLWPARFRALFFSGIIVSSAAFVALFRVADYHLASGTMNCQWGSLAILAVVGFLGLDSSGAVRGVVKWALVVDSFCKVLTRHWIRQSLIGDQYNFLSIPVQTQQSVLIAVAGTFVLGGVMGLWMWEKIRKEGISI